MSIINFAPSFSLGLGAEIEGAREELEGPLAGDQVYLGGYRD